MDNHEQGFLVDSKEVAFFWKLKAVSPVMTWKLSVVNELSASETENGAIMYFLSEFWVFLLTINGLRFFLKKRCNE